MQSPAPTFLNTLNLWFTPVIDSTSCRDGTIQDLLSESENTRLNRIRSPNKRCEYLSGRALMRHALSREFQIGEEQWQFIERPGLAPDVANLPDNTYLSLSHSRGLICFAVADSPVGIDIEASAKQRDFIALAEVFMNDEELEILLQQKSASADYFYRVWCAKEAY